MRCTSCSSENPHGMKFCGVCGKPLGCPYCGGENPYGMIFCGHCGKTLSQAQVVTSASGRTEIHVKSEKLSSATLIAISAVATAVLVLVAIAIWYLTGA